MSCLHGENDDKWGDRWHLFQFVNIRVSKGLDQSKNGIMERRSGGSEKERRNRREVTQWIRLAPLSTQISDDWLGKASTRAEIQITGIKKLQRRILFERMVASFSISSSCGCFSAAIKIEISDKWPSYFKLRYGALVQWKLANTTGKFDARKSTLEVFVISTIFTRIRSLTAP